MKCSRAIPGQRASGEFSAYLSHGSWYSNGGDVGKDAWVRENAWGKCLPLEKDVLLLLTQLGLTLSEQSHQGLRIQAGWSVVSSFFEWSLDFPGSSDCISPESRKSGIAFKTVYRFFKKLKCYQKCYFFLAFITVWYYFYKKIICIEKLYCPIQKRVHKYFQRKRTKYYFGNMVSSVHISRRLFLVRMWR